MEPQDLINWLGAVAVGLFGWIMNQFKNDVKALQDAHLKLQATQQVHEVHVARGYVTRAELEDCMVRLDNKLDKIFDKLDGKEDKKRQ